MIGSIEKRRSGVEINHILETLLNLLEIRPVKQGVKGKSQKYIGVNDIVSINPNNGVLIQVNPAKERLRK